LKEFKVPPWRQKQINKKYARKSKVVHNTVREISEVIKDAVEKIIDTGLFSGQYLQPSLNGINVIVDRFYVGVIEEAYYACKDEKQAQKGKKKLAKGPKGIPRDLENLHQVFQDKKYFKAIMKRSRALSERMKKQYLQKLKRKFNKIVPMLTRGEISPVDAKKEMMNVWGASKSRVETIFRTETTNYFGKVQVNFFQDDDEIIGFLFDSNIDSSITDICRSRHGMIFTKEHTGKNSLAYNTPALHYNCRSHLIPLANTPENRKLLEDVSRDPSKHKLAELPDDWR
jgi:SPP1 gp7 family putative phage head morphogenesis protein